MRPPRALPCAVLLLPTLLLSDAAAAAAPSLSFRAPAALPGDHGAFVDSVTGFGGTHQEALGYGTGFFGTLDGGRTWQVPQPWQQAAAGGSNSTTFAVLSSDGTRLHNLGDIVGATAAAAAVHGNITSVRTNASTTFTVIGGKFAATLWQAPAPNSSISFDGIPTPGIKSLRTGGADWLRLPDGSIVGSLIVGWGTVSGKRASIAAFRSTDDGFAWTFAGDIARADDPRVPSNEGPNENTLALLANGTLLCVMRLDAGDAGRYHRYAASFSSDGKAQTWSVATMLNGVGAARPRLLRLGTSLLLSGGRTWKKNRDTVVWLNAAGDGELWQPHSISYWHNTLVSSNSTPKFDPAATNASDHWPRESNSYTSLVQTGPSSAFVTYSFKGAYGFAMPIELLA
jgi:hypothetical protein